MLCDGSTNIFPVPVYQEPQNPVEIHENLKNVHAAWKLQFDNIIHSLKSGFYQGWDLHPGQIPSATLHSILFIFLLSENLSKNEKLFRKKALLSSNVFDDAATKV